MQAGSAGEIGETLRLRGIRPSTEYSWPILLALRQILADSLKFIPHYSDE
jgi:hypothetical protein